MAKVSRLHRFHLPTTTYATIADDDEEYPHPFSFDFDSLSSPNNHIFFIHSHNFNSGSDSDSGHLGLLADSNSFIIDDDQMNFITDLFVTRDGKVTEDPNSNFFLEDVCGDFGSDFDGVLLPSDSNGVLLPSDSNGARVMGIESEANSQEVELNARDIDDQQIICQFKVSL